ncbi:MAG: ABC transporter, partial [Nocardioides sp.]
MVNADADPYVRVRAAAEHNLRDVDVDLPRNAIVVFTGVSGSGKSSLAFDTIYAEAQRRYFESVAPYARRLLQQIDTPHVQEISGLPPAVALRQQRGAVSSRSTVGTITTLSNLLRMLFSRAGSYPAGAPHLAADAFSPNTVVGACPTCHGLGVRHDVAEELLVPDVSLTIREGAIAAWPGAWQGHNLRRVTKNLGIDVDTPWSELAREDRTWLLFTDERPAVLIRPRDKDGGGGRDYMGTFRSARAHVQQVLAKSSSQKSREQMLGFMRSSTCDTCAGAGLRPEALAVTFNGGSIAELSTMPLTELTERLRPSAAGDDVASRLSADLVARLEVLVRLGLGYLSLRRSSTTLSSGEAQRLRIATQLRAGLFGVAYVLDEPSAGLHPAEAEPLLEVLEQLKAGGNSVLVVEHNLDVIRRADWVVDVGPGAGAAGGRIVYSGPLAGLEAITESPTSRHVFGRAPRVEHVDRTPSGWVELSDIRIHNLQGLRARVPVGCLTAVTGVSGAGKTTLLIDVLAESVRRHVGASRSSMGTDEDRDGAERARGDVTGVEAFDRLVVVDQRPIGRTPRSNVATYVGLFDTVRRLFAETPEAGRRGYGPGRFSSNVVGGRCEVCRGEGVQNVELLFLP